MPKPPPQRGRIGDAIGIFDHRRRSLPPTAFHEVAPQRLAAGHQAIVAIRRRERRQQRERLAANIAESAPNRNPIVVFVMGLFATAAVSDNRVAQTNRASADDLGASLGPVGVEVVLRGRKWDKENRDPVGSARGGDLAKIPSPEWSPHLLRRRPTGEEYRFRPTCGSASKRIGRLMGR